MQVDVEVLRLYQRSITCEMRLLKHEHVVGELRSPRGLLLWVSEVGERLAVTT